MTLKYLRECSSHNANFKYTCEIEGKKYEKLPRTVTNTNFKCLLARNMTNSLIAWVLYVLHSRQLYVTYTYTILTNEINSWQQLYDF